jgi:hypothetical protein
VDSFTFGLKLYFFENIFFERVRLPTLLCTGFKLEETCSTATSEYLSTQKPWHYYYYYENTL